MTAFTPTDLPASINSVEKLVVWAAEVLQNLYPLLTTVEMLDDKGNQVQSFVIESNKFFLTASTTPGWRHLSRASLPLAQSHQLSGKIWQHIGDLGSASIPADMKN